MEEVKVNYHVYDNNTGISLNTKANCIFCFRDCTEFSAASSTEDRKELRERFCELLSRHLGADFKSAFYSTEKSMRPMNLDYMNKWSENVGIDIGAVCSDCFTLMENFCGLFSEMKTLELRLDWQVQKLRNIMVFAERVPTRWKIFKEQFSSNEWASFSKIVEFRTELLRKYAQKVRTTYPRIFLKRRTAPISVTGNKKRRKRISLLMNHEEKSITENIKSDSEVEVQPTNSNQIYSGTENNTLSINLYGEKEKYQVCMTQKQDNHWNYFCPEAEIDVVDDNFQALSPQSGPSIIETHNDSDNEDVSICNGYGEFSSFSDSMQVVSGVPIITSVYESQNEHVEVVDLESENTDNILEITKSELPSTEGTIRIISMQKIMDRTSAEPEHIGNLNLCCTSCKMTFLNEPSLHHHIQECGTPREKNPNSQAGDKSGANNTQQADGTVTSFGTVITTELCSVCQKPIPVDSLAKHMSSHSKSRTKTRVFMCLYCSSRFRDRNKLKRHKTSMKHKLNRQQYKANLINNVDSNKIPSKNDVKVVKIIYVKNSSNL